MGTAARDLIPFRLGTRKRRALLATITYNGTTAQQRPAPVQLPKVGLLSRLVFVVTGTIDYAAVGTFSAYGWADLFNRIQVNANIGSTSVVDVSGRGAVAAASLTLPGAVKGTRPVASGTTYPNIKFTLPVTVNANSGRNFELGLVNLQDPQIQVSLVVVWNPLTSVVSDALDTSALTLNVWEEYFEIPDPTVFALPPRALVRTLEDFSSGLVAGDNAYEMPRLGTLLSYQGIVAIAGTTPIVNDNVTSLAVRFNRTDTVEQYDGLAQSAWDGLNYPDIDGFWPGVFNEATPNRPGDVDPVNLLPGVFTFDYWAAEGAPSQGDLRDAIDTELLTTTEFVFTLGGTYAPVAADVIQNVRRVVQVLA